MHNPQSKFYSDSKSKTKSKLSEQQIIQKITEEFNEIFDEYTPISLLGQGSYGLVIQAKDKFQNKFAIKKFTNLYRDRIDTKRILREIAILSQLSHPNVVRLHDIIIKDLEKVDSLYIVLECCDVDLKKLLNEKNFSFQMKELKKVFFEMMCGLDYLHRCGVLHRDLKPGNIVLNADFSTKICDFGLSRDFTMSYSDNEIKNLIDQNSEVKNEINSITENESIDNNLAIYRINEIVNDFKSTLLLNYLDSKSKPPQTITFNSKLVFKDPNNMDLVSSTKNNLFFNLDTPLDFSFEAYKENMPILSASHNNEITISLSQNNNLIPIVKPKNLLFEERKPESISEINSLLRNLTRHVSTRWYRSPEIILMEDYSAPSDIWAAGCVFGEMLGKLKGNNYYGAFFKGTSCYPLSPSYVENKATKERRIVFDNYDQLNVIFNIMGTPKKDELQFLSDEKVNYIRKFAVRPMISFQKYFPYASNDSLSFLKKMLKFNPKDRLCITDIIKDPLFSEFKYVHVPENEIINKFDSDNENQDFLELRALFIEQYERFKSNMK